MKRILLDSATPFFKGNMHCHSTVSDGTLTPQELKELYRAHGYHFIAFTDHEHVVPHPELNDDRFVAITGAEYAIKEFPEQSTLRNWDMKVCHLNLYAKDAGNYFSVCYNEKADHFSHGEYRKNIKKPDKNYSRVYGAEGINDLIRQANENGFFVAYNHPRWSLENYGDYGGYEGLWGVEIYNTATNRAGLYEYDVNVLDDMLRDGKRVFASCGDDNHNGKRLGLRDSCVAFVMVNAKELSYAAIVDGLLRGNFYSSTGPLIYDLSVEEGVVHVRSSEAVEITLSTRGRRSDIAMAEEGKTVTEASFPLCETDGYFRIDVVDAQGRRANSQAYFLEEL